MRGALFLLIGLFVLGYGIWQLSGVVVIPLNTHVDEKELVLGYRRTEQRPKIVVLSGGAGMFMMASMGKHGERLTCITPIQDPVEYYYRASSLFTAEYVDYLPPTPVPAQVIAELSDGTQIDLKHIRQVVRDPLLVDKHVAQLALHWLSLADGTSESDSVPPLSRPVLDAIAEADALVLGPGSLFESILPDLLISEFREAIQRSQPRIIYVCNLMTEPGLTSGFSVADHIRAIKRYGGFTPDYVLVNAERIEPEVRRMYEIAKQVPVYLDPEAYEETAVLASDGHGRQKGILVEGAVVLEADLASDLFQSTASINNPGESRAVRVLRHDPDKLATAILALLKRE